MLCSFVSFSEQERLLKHYRIINLANEGCIFLVMLPCHKYGVTSHALYFGPNRAQTTNCMQKMVNLSLWTQKKPKNTSYRMLLFMSTTANSFLLRNGRFVGRGHPPPGATRRSHPDRGWVVRPPAHAHSGRVSGGALPRCRGDGLVLHVGGGVGPRCGLVQVAAHTQGEIISFFSLFFFFLGLCSNSKGKFSFFFLFFLFFFLGLCSKGKFENFDENLHNPAHLLWKNSNHIFSTSSKNNPCACKIL